MEGEAAPLQDAATVALMAGDNCKESAAFVQRFLDWENRRE